MPQQDDRAHKLLSSTTVIFILVEFIVGLVLQATKPLVLFGGPSFRLGQQVGGGGTGTPLLLPSFVFSPVFPTRETLDQLFAYPLAGTDDYSAHS